MSDSVSALALPSGWAARLAYLVGRDGGYAQREAFRFVVSDESAEPVALSFGEWWRRSRQLADGLAAAGVGRGDRIAVMAGGGQTWPLVQIASSLLGAVVVPVNVRYRIDELRHVVRVARPRVVFIGEWYLDRGLLEALELEGVLASIFTDAAGASAPRPDVNSWSGLVRAGGETSDRPPGHDGTEPGLMQFTSGTTAFAKAALLTERATLNVAYFMGERIGLGEQDVVFSTQPFYHVGGSVTTTLMPLARGCCMVVPDRYTPEGTLLALARYECTARYGQGAMYAMELAHDSFRAGSFPLLRKGWGLGPRPLLERVHEQMGITGLVQLYGLTECSGVSMVADHQADLNTRLTTCGQPFPGVELRIASESGPGELCIRGWSLMRGYVSDDGSLDPGLDDEGWFHTGDVGVLDDQGNFCFADRLKDMIKPGGENVAPAEIERVLLQHPGVAEVAVVGCSDERLGEVPVAFVRWHTGAESAPDDLLNLAAARMASFKVPRRIVAVDSLPMTPSGKVRKADLRDRLGSSPTSFVGQSG